jgi:hypothetical protein
MVSTLTTSINGCKSPNVRTLEYEIKDLSKETTVIAYRFLNKEIPISKNTYMKQKHTKKRGKYDHRTW